MANFVSEVTVFEAVITGKIQELDDIRNRNKNAINIRDGRGYQAAHLAAECGQSTVIQWLARNGYPLNNESSTGYSPIHIACERGNIDCVLALKMGGANLKAKTGMDRLSPLHLACRVGELNIAQFLIKNGLDPKEKDGFGKNAIENAATNGHKPLVDYLAKEMKLDKPPPVSNVKIAENKRQKRMTDEEVKALRMNEYKKMQAAESGGKKTFLDLVRRESDKKK
jgi:ankyrin repeat protein